MNQILSTRQACNPIYQISEITKLVRALARGCQFIILLGGWGLTSLIAGPSTSGVNPLRDFEQVGQYLPHAVLIRIGEQLCWLDPDNDTHWDAVSDLGRDLIMVRPQQFDRLTSNQSGLLRRTILTRLPINQWYQQIVEAVDLGTPSRHVRSLGNIYFRILQSLPQFIIKPTTQDGRNLMAVRILLCIMTFLEREVHELAAMRLKMIESTNSSLAIAQAFNMRHLLPMQLIAGVSSSVPRISRDYLAQQEITRRCVDLLAYIALIEQSETVVEAVFSHARPEDCAIGLYPMVASRNAWLQYKTGLIRRASFNDLGIEMLQPWLALIDELFSNDVGV